MQLHLKLIYFYSNPYDGLLETHNVDKSLEGKLKCVIMLFSCIQLIRRFLYLTILKILLHLMISFNYK